MSNDLLRHEERCFRQVEHALTAGAASAETLLKSRWKRNGKTAAGLQGDHDFATTLLTLHSQVLVECAEHVRVLTDTAVTLAVRSMDAELRLCERTLGTRYKGVAQAGVERGTVMAPGLVTTALRDYEQIAGASLTAFQAMTRQQIAFSVQRLEGLDELGRRLLSAKSVRLQGNGGRGAWWRTMSEVNRGARAVSIGVSNGVREACMVGMNEAGRGRD